MFFPVVHVFAKAVAVAFTGGEARGDVNSAIAELQQCGPDHPVTLYLNALLRESDSVKITSLADIREGNDKNYAVDELNFVCFQKQQE